MSRRLVQNFSGMRAILVTGPGRSREVLQDTLERLGLKVTTRNASAETEPDADVLASAEVVFFDADIAETPLLPHGVALAPVPLVVMVGLESPGRLQRAFDLGPSAIIHKPIRSSGIYSALFFAMNEHTRRAETLERLRGMERRRGSRRFVHKALMRIMSQHCMNDEEAYALLRKESMKQRLTVEEMAARIVAETPARRVARKA
jgi:two-component system, response regulator / RNA-binding antiterminator